MHVIDSIEYLLITLKILYPEDLGRWYLILLVYIILSITMMFIALIATLGIFVAFFGMVGGVKYFTNKNRGWVYMGISYPLISKIVGNFFLLMSFWICADMDMLGINPEAEMPHVVVERTGYALIFLSFPTLIIWYLFKQNWGVIPFDYYEIGMKEKVSKEIITDKIDKDKNDLEEEQKLV